MEHTRRACARVTRHVLRGAPYGRPVPFTLRNIKEELEDIGSRFDGAPDHR
jgi:hypothetical protein